MAKRDYYEVLGVGRDATPSQIKSAYRKLARKFHPDVNKAADAADKFREATEAYEVLSDDKRRPMYDKFGHAAPSTGGGPGGGPRWGGPRGGQRGGVVDIGEMFGGGFAGMSLEEILGTLGGGGHHPRRGRRGGGARGHGHPFGGGPFGATYAADVAGQDVEHHLNLDFMQAVLGTTATLRITADDGSAETINVRIPPGVKEGSRVRVRGKGQAGPGGAGDLYIVTHVGEHAYFRREENDIYLDAPLSFAEAALGAKIDVPTVTGDRMTVTIPPGMASGQKLRLRGKGVTPPGGEAGDQYVVVKIVPPRNLSANGRRLMEEFAQTEPYDPRKDVPWHAK
ncbi:MAG: DnaJ domain-containing protein [Phycisphaerae bacterium]|nr:DnaJ domain-containing protein [Phycisphaerae bacterium]